MKEIVFFTTKANKGRWIYTAKKMQQTLQEWICATLNTDFDFEYESDFTQSPEEMPAGLIGYIKISVPDDNKRAWVYYSKQDGVKLRHWMVSKLNAGVKNGEKK